MNAKSYKSIPIEGISFGFGNRNEFDGICSLTVIPYVILKWPDAYTLVQATIRFCGSPCDSQRMDAQTNDEFGLEDFSAMLDGLRRIHDGTQGTCETRGCDGAFSVQFARTDERVSLALEIGSPYTQRVLAHQKERAHGNRTPFERNDVFVGSCVAEFLLTHQALSDGIMQLARVLEELRHRAAS